MDDEEVSFTLSYRPTGFINWIKSMLGIGVTHWYLTNQRLIEHTEIAGGFNFQDVPIDSITSVEYGQKLSLPLIGVGILLTVFGLVSLMNSPTVGVLLFLFGIALVGYAFYRRQQNLVVHASGGVTLGLRISKGQQVDEFQWYVNAERQKQRIK